MKTSIQAALALCALMSFGFANPASAQGVTVMVAEHAACPVAKAAKRVGCAGIHLVHGAIHLVTGTTADAVHLVTGTTGCAVGVVSDSFEIAAPVMHRPASLIKNGAQKLLGGADHVVDKTLSVIDKGATKAVDLVPAAAGAASRTAGAVVNELKGEPKDFVNEDNTTDMFISQ